LAQQFNDRNIRPSQFELDIGPKVLKADPVVSKGAPVYSGASTEEVFQFFKDLGGVDSMPNVKTVPGKGDIYVITTPSGSKFTLRDFSSTAEQSGAKWTIDVIDPSINGGNRVEIKFR
jgi:filamentous hemagglutinin